jgi:pimeloyl-ACP methyl ester carboxylesterase
VALDARGHGAGLRSRRFRLVDCRDDAVAVVDALGLERVLLVGYSMGGAVAELVCQARPELVRGLVLCATQTAFPRHGLQKLTYPMLYAVSPLAGLAPPRVRDRILSRSESQDGSALQRWAGTQLRRNDVRTMLQAPLVLSRFDASAWISHLPMPASVIVTARDGVVPPDRQRDLAARLADATRYEIDGTHGVFVERASAFADVVVRACVDVHARSIAVA